MNSVYCIEPTEKTPLVILDPDKNKFEIIGVSVPQDGRDFYQPVLDWLKDYNEHPLELTEFVFNLDYFNISSSSIFLYYLSKFKEFNQSQFKNFLLLQYFFRICLNY